MKKVLITGGDSFLANSLYPRLIKDGFIVEKYNRKELDVLNFELLKGVFLSKYYDAVIHCAAVGGRRNQPDTPENAVLNLKMQENLLFFKSYYNKLFIFDSGASFDRKESIFLRAENTFTSVPIDNYGFSKYLNTKRASFYNNVINLRIFNLFGLFEAEDRFIKKSINNYINKQNIEIFENKAFDFFSESDLYKVIFHFLNKGNVSYEEYNCVYQEKKSLLDIAKFINTLSNHMVKIYCDKESEKNYCASGEKLNSLKINFNGLEKSIKEIYNTINEQFIEKQNI